MPRVVPLVKHAYLNGILDWFASLSSHLVCERCGHTGGGMSITVTGGHVTTGCGNCGIHNMHPRPPFLVSKSVKKVLAAMLAADEDMGVSGIAKASGVGVGGVGHILANLCGHDWIRRDGSKHADLPRYEQDTLPPDQRRRPYRINPAFRHAIESTVRMRTVKDVDPAEDSRPTTPGPVRLTVDLDEATVTWLRGLGHDTAAQMSSAITGHITQARDTKTPI